MKGTLHVTALVVACATAACGPRSIDDFLPYQDVVQWVDPMIGTRGSGNVIPGALVPHGVVRLGPDTFGEPGSISVYEHSDPTLEGFVHTALEGPGGSKNGFGHVLVAPTRGELGPDPLAYASTLSHDDEDASPGYYTVGLPDHQATFEGTATHHCGVHRYTFTGDETANLQIDLVHSQGDWVEGEVSIDSDRVISGRAIYQIHPLVSTTLQALTGEGTTGRRPVFFHAELSRPFDTFGTWSGDTITRGASSATEGEIGAFVAFTDPSSPVELRLCLSSIDTATARAHFEAEVAERTFEEVKSAASETWNKVLNRFHVKGGTDAQRTIFYTALYHSLFQPADHGEQGWAWIGADGEGQVVEVGEGGFFTDDWCMWDTFHTTHPLQLLVEPERRADVVNSILRIYQAGGWLPKCTWQAAGYSRVMIGNHAFPIITEPLLKGFEGIDEALAWEALWKTATDGDEGAELESICGYFDLGTPLEYITEGYVSHECDGTQGASMTLEQALDDWTVARFARKTGRDEAAATLEARAAFYRNHFDPTVGFMRGRLRGGDWVSPFDPTDTSDFNDFAEASSWIYTFFVPHDPAGLATLLGGREAMEAKLDAYFDGGHHDMSNEPGFFTPYLYSYVGAPSKTQARIRALADATFSTEPGGLPGNDDAGAMSAWYVFAAAGLYPAPGHDVYVLTAPIFDEITLWLEPSQFKGESFTIVAERNAPTDLYIQSAKLDGKVMDHAWLTFEEIAEGGRLVLTLGAEPSTWGSAPQQAPPSMSDLR